MYETTLYCGIGDVINVLTQDGVDYRTLDTPPTQYGGVIDEASSIIEEYCLRLYTPAVLSGARWVTWKCANIAAYLLCERAGNPPPPGITAKHERAMASLEKVQNGNTQIPGASQIRTCAPVLSNVRVRLDPFPRTVVEPNRSSQQMPADYVQWCDVFDWWSYQWALICSVVGAMAGMMV